MKLSKQQKHLELKLVAKAAFSAIKQYFTGVGVERRTVTFLKGVGITFAYSVGGCIAALSWAAVAGVLIGPGHEDFLRNFHAWMIETPVDQVVARGDAFVRVNAEQILTMSLNIAFLWRLGKVAEPAITEAKQRFRAELAELGGDTPRTSPHTSDNP